MSELNLKKVLGLKESVGMTIGTVVGVGLFTCGSTQIGYLGSSVIVLTLFALLISIWPCLIYGEMASIMPCSGGTYNYAKRGLGKLPATIVGWNYIISVVAICSGESLAFANYFAILLEQLGIDISWIDERLIAIPLIFVFLTVNYRGIRQSGKVQNFFTFFFWACSAFWFILMLPRTHLEYFGSMSIEMLPPIKEIFYMFGMIWWCYTGFEACVSMGAETKYPQYTLHRALKLSIFIVFISNAIFQWFLIALVSPENYSVIATSDAPYAEGLKVSGLIGAPVIALCVAIAFGGDFATINPCIAAPSRYFYTMAIDNVFPTFLGKIHPKFNTPHIAIMSIGLINIVLIATGSIVYIASVSLVSLALCYIIGCLSYIGFKVKYPNIKRPYKAPWGVFGCIFTIIVYIFMLSFAEVSALITTAFISIISSLYWLLFSRRKNHKLPPIEEEIGIIEEPEAGELKKMNREYAIWKWIVVAFTVGVIILYANVIIHNKIHYYPL